MSGKRLNIVGIIPARMGSSRFPGKPLEKILNIPMVGHVYFRSKMSESLSEVCIATCDKEIGQYADSIGAKWVMTKDSHERASDRAAEAMEKIEEQTGQRVDVVVMIQGDEPMVMPEMIDMAVKPMVEDSNIGSVNLMAPIKSVEEQHDRNCIKVVVDENNFATRFSREPLSMFKQVCIMPFTREFLLKFNELKPTPLEIAESIDMNRFLEHGYKVKMVLENFQTQAVDTPEDIRKVLNLMADDSLLKNYARN
ncbi:MAG: 3-deoxy-manno-octulosonate cytidylyltransferase [Candidatus Zambryskibacteria bacterium]|nr:3-deoxy-manno-octulosonate cytidylyltransferase [Candidatus Zambryskibacteria bacterium]